jgi:hypothetical protein
MSQAPNCPKCSIPNQPQLVSAANPLTDWFTNAVTPPWLLPVIVAALGLAGVAVVVWVIKD